MQRLEFTAMGCGVLAVLGSDTPEARQQLAQVPAWFAEWERQLSRFRVDSDLSRLNRSAGRWVSLRPTLWEVVRAALWAARWSEGLVTPTLLTALELAGYDRSFERLGSGPTAGPGAGRRSAGEPGPSGKPGQAGAPAADWRAIELNARGRAVRLPPGMRLDLGGVAKGWAADRAARRLGRLGPALVDAGGDIATGGGPPVGGLWPLGVADPVGPGPWLELLGLAHGGVATSGRDHRRWWSGNRWSHHIVDPRTGRPAETDVLSATVVAPTAREAETASKAALILGSAAGLAWLERRPSLAGLLVLENGQVVRSRRFADHVWR